MAIDLPVSHTGRSGAVDVRSLVDFLTAVAPIIPKQQSPINVWQAVFQWSFLTLIVLVILTSLAVRFLHWFISVPLALVFVMQIFYMVWVGLMVYPDLNSLRRPIGSFWAEHGPQAQSDYEIVCRAAEWPEPVLRFTAARLRSQADHLRLRIAIFLGALDKVGLLPLIASTAFTAWKLFGGGSAPKFATPTVLCLTAIFLVVIYWYGLAFMFLSQRLEQLAEVVEAALEQCTRKKELTTERIYSATA